MHIAKPKEAVVVRETWRQGYDSHANWAKEEVASKRILLLVCAKHETVSKYFDTCTHGELMNSLCKTRF